MELYGASHHDEVDFENVRSFGVTRKFLEVREFLWLENNFPPRESRKWRFNLSRSDGFPFFPLFCFFFRILRLQLCWDH